LGFKDDQIDGDVGALSGGKYPIGTDQPNFFAGVQLKRSVHEEQLLAQIRAVFEQPGVEF